MLTCKQTSRLISEGLDHHLPFYKRILIHLHLKACVTCGYYQRQLRQLNRLLTDYPDEVDQSSLTAARARELSDLIRQRRS